MKRFNFVLFFLAFISFALRASTFFPFNEVNHKWNISINGGYAPNGKAFVFGWGVTIRGFHFMIGGTGSTHENDIDVGNWSEKASFMFRVGYQIPIVRAIRITPIIGMTGVGEATTDGYDYTVDNGYIQNEVSTDLKYKFDYGGSLTFSHRKLIVNLAVTRYTLIGGIGLEF